MSVSSEFVLFREGAERPPGGPPPEPFGLGPGPCYLVAAAGEEPSVLPSPPAGPAWLLSAVTVACQQRLLVLSPRGRGARLNGQPAPPAALAAVRDELQFAGGPLLFVSVRHGARVGPPPPEGVGSVCPVCRDLITPASRVYACPGCGTLMHLEGEGRGEARLECALIARECLACQAPVVLHQGYAWVPED